MVVTLSLINLAAMAQTGIGPVASGIVPHGATISR